MSKFFAAVVAYIKANPGTSFVVALAMAGIAYVFVGPLHATDAKIDAQLIAAVVGFVIPYLTAFATKLHASPWLKALVAALLAGFTALGANLAGVTGAVSAKGLFETFVIAVVVAAGSRTTLTGHSVTALATATKDTGLGDGTPPQNDSDYAGAKAA